jgi:hypothetical protein
METKWQNSFQEPQKNFIELSELLLEDLAPHIAHAHVLVQQGTPQTFELFELSTSVF